jgi:hypothetical protein
VKSTQGWNGSAELGLNLPVQRGHVGDEVVQLPGAQLIVKPGDGVFQLAQLLDCEIVVILAGLSNRIVGAEGQGAKRRGEIGHVVMAVPSPVRLLASLNEARW